MEKLYIDSISLFVFLKLLFNKRDKYKIKILNDQSFNQEVLIKILSFLGYNINIESFFFGNLKGKNGESLHITARNKASILSLEFSKWIMGDKQILKNEKKCKDSKRVVELFISKRTMLELEYYTQRIEYIKYQNKHNDRISLWIRESLLINKKFLYNCFSDYNLFFIESIRRKTFFIMKNNLKKIKTLYSFLKIKKLINHDFSIVSLASDEINLNTNRRHFPHWLNRKNDYSTLIINKGAHKVRLDKNDLTKNDISIINDLETYISSLFKKRILRIDNKKNFQIELRTYLNDLLLLSENSYYFFKKIKCKRFVYLEPQDPITDAIQLISKELNIKTICIQYANLGVVSPLMIPSSDYFLVFSKMYENVFKWKDLGPKKFKHIGYSFIYNALDNNEVNFNIDDKCYVISYFDESVQNYKWGYHSEDANIEMIEKLSDLVINNKNVMVILKPQFVFNTIKKNNSTKIDKALRTGRLVEIKEGTHRNLITPSQIAKISDLSIAHIGGGTAALEIALNNTKVVLIDEGGYKTQFDSIYIDGKVKYNSLNEILELIPENPNKEDILIGDWSGIINNFSKNHLKSKELINKIISD